MSRLSPVQTSRLAHTRNDEHTVEFGIGSAGAHVRPAPSSHGSTGAGQFASAQSRGGHLPASGLAVLAPRPAARPALAVLQLLLSTANAPLPGRFLLGV